MSILEIILIDNCWVGYGRNSRKSQGMSEDICRYITKRYAQRRLDDRGKDCRDTREMGRSNI